MNACGNNKLTGPLIDESESVLEIKRPFIVAIILMRFDS